MEDFKRMYVINNGEPAGWGWKTKTTFSIEVKNDILEISKISGRDMRMDEIKTAFGRFIEDYENQNGTIKQYERQNPYRFVSRIGMSGAEDTYIEVMKNEEFPTRKFMMHESCYGKCGHIKAFVYDYLDLNVAKGIFNIRENDKETYRYARENDENRNMKIISLQPRDVSRERGWIYPDTKPEQREVVDVDENMYIDNVDLDIYPYIALNILKADGFTAALHDLGRDMDIGRFSYFKDNYKFAEKLINMYPETFLWFDSEVQEEIVEHAEIDGDGLDYDDVMNAIIDSIDYFDGNDLAPNIANDEDIMKTLMEKSGGEMYIYAGSDIRYNPDMAKFAVQLDGDMIEYVPSNIEKYKEIALEAVKEYPPAIQRVALSALGDSDIEVVKVAVANDKKNDYENILAIVPARYQDNTEVVKASYEKNPESIQFASQRIQDGVEKYGTKFFDMENRPKTIGDLLQTAKEIRDNEAKAPKSDDKRNDDKKSDEAGPGDL